MDTQRLLTSLSLKIIIQFGIVVGMLAFAIAWNFDFIYRFYFENQQTQTGILINTAIASLMVVGMGNILYLLLCYKYEEDSIAGFVNNIDSLRPDLLQGLPRNALVVKRYATMQSIQSAAGEINHSALSAMLTADEGTRFGLVRFINNILILTGVFGTIVSLSIALLGASDLIDSAAGSLGGMGLVIHGMSTALSTTITAIVSYVIFGYFYTRLSDVQTHLISGIEHLTSVYLMPKFVKTSEDITNRMAGLIKAVIMAGDKLNSTQEVYQETALTLQQSISSNQQQMGILFDDMADIKSLLREGFRLPQPEDNSEQ
ncbi:MAG: hypothetical protein ACERLB_06695 [Gammaproteobacteria bacterium]